jgi:AcrR family transcriptional regulator
VLVARGVAAVCSSRAVSPCWPGHEHAPAGRRRRFFVLAKNERSCFYFSMSKGQETRQAILARAFEIATVAGLQGLSIGHLAEQLELSKSGLFAHFGSKEALQVAVIEEAGRLFVQDTLLPALRAARGEPRVRALFNRWIEWGNRPGGCFFVAACAELDDRPGVARDALVTAQKAWLDEISTAVRIAIQEGHFRDDLDAEQFAFDAYSIMLGTHLFNRFLHDPAAPIRTRRSFDALIAAARSPDRKRG